MNVLYLTMNPNRQSTTVPTEGWLRFLPVKGLTPVLVSREDGAFPAWARAAGVPTRVDPLPLPDRRRPLPFICSVARLVRLSRRHRIDLIHCNEQDVYPIGQYLGRLIRRPVVVSVHFRMERAYCQWAFAGRRAPARMFFVSGRSLDACRPALAGIVADHRQEVLWNGLDLQRYVPDPYLGQQFRDAHGLSADQPLVGVACAFRPRKQLEHLFEAVSRLDRRDVAVVIAGYPTAGDEAYARDLLAAGAARLGPRLKLVGSLDDVRGLMNALDLYVNTSQEESFGISALEAMACGCPVVGYDSKAVDEVVLPDGGEMVPQDDIASLVRAMDRWLSDNASLRVRRPTARRQAERFDLRVLSDQLWRSYQAVLGSTAVPEPVSSAP